MSNAILKVGWSLAIAGVLSAPAVAGDRTAARQVSRRLLLRVSASNSVPVQRLVRAQREAVTVFAQIGVDVDWVGCGLERSAHSDERPTPLSIGVQVTSLDGRALHAIPHEAIGAVVRTIESEEIAFVLFDRVERAADRYALDSGVLLGHAIAHEVGHLLLPRGTHGPAGLMRARWRMEDLRAAVQGQLGFSESEATLIRAQLE